MMNYYKFTPLPKNLIWGTEIWQISGVPGSETMCEGQNINDIVKKEKARLVGEANYKRFGDEFPLLIKFIDAHQDLSIQVHPTDEVAHRQGKPRGKTEMWYLLDSKPGAALYNGLKEQLTPEQYEEMVNKKTICDALAPARTPKFTTLAVSSCCACNNRGKVTISINKNLFIFLFILLIGNQF